MSDSNYLIPTITPVGLSMIIQTLKGDSLTFTRLVLGNGVPEDLTDVDDVVNPLLDIPFVSITEQTNYLLLVGEITSSSIQESFYGKELGVYAKGDDNVERLYAYRYSEEADFYPSSDSGRTLELRISVVVQVGSAENVTAILVEGDAYAPKVDFDAHVANTNNPHSVTKDQVGLGDVPNVTTNEQTPTFTEASSRSNIVSGETLSVIFGKIAKLFTDFTSHLSASNPHNITPSKIGASPTSHTHSTSDINSGVLSVVRGGTGVNSLANLATSLHNNTTLLDWKRVNSNYVKGGTWQKIPNGAKEIYVAVYIVWETSRIVYVDFIIPINTRLFYNSNTRINTYHCNYWGQEYDGFVNLQTLYNTNGYFVKLYEAYKGTTDAISYTYMDVYYR